MQRMYEAWGLVHSGACTETARPHTPETTSVPYETVRIWSLWVVSRGRRWRAAAVEAGSRIAALSAKGSRGRKREAARPSAKGAATKSGAAPYHVLEEPVLHHTTRAEAHAHHVDVTAEDLNDDGHVTRAEAHAVAALKVKGLL